MLIVTPHDLATVASPTADLVKNEILRVGAPLAELKVAITFVSGQKSFDARAYDALSPRLRRLVDLVGVAGTTFARSICEAVETANPRPRDSDQASRQV